MKSLFKFVSCVAKNILAPMLTYKKPHNVVLGIQPEKVIIFSPLRFVKASVNRPLLKFRKIQAVAPGKVLQRQSFEMFKSLHQVNFLLFRVIK